MMPAAEAVLPDAASKNEQLDEAAAPQGTAADAKRDATSGQACAPPSGKAQVQISANSPSEKQGHSASPDASRRQQDLSRVDELREYLLSQEFKSSVQVTAGVLPYIAENR